MLRQRAALNDDEAFARLPKIISRDRRAKRVGKKREAERCVAEKSAARSLVTSNTERHYGVERQKEEGRTGRMDNMQVTMGEAIRERESVCVSVCVCVCVSGIEISANHSTRVR